MEGGEHASEGRAQGKKRRFFLPRTRKKFFFRKGTSNGIGEKKTSQRKRDNSSGTREKKNRSLAGKAGVSKHFFFPKISTLEILGEQKASSREQKVFGKGGTSPDPPFGKTLAKRGIVGMVNLGGGRSPPAPTRAPYPWVWGETLGSLPRKKKGGP